jgi:type II secretory pathway pseudopilin PulG
VRNRTKCHSEEGYTGGSNAARFGLLRRASLRSVGFTPRGLVRNPRGFTLVEVVVAAAVLIIRIIGLSGVFARGVSGFKQAQLMTLGQNLAEFLVEDVKNLLPSVLHQLVQGEYQNVNYPYPDAADDAYADDAQPWMYDSGKLQTDFKVDAITSIVGTEETFVAGTHAMPDVPGVAEVLLGSNVVVERYGVGPNEGDPDYWEDDEGWYYWTGETRTRLTGVPPLGTDYYYQVVLQREAYPQFSRQIRIAEYDWDTPLSSDVWESSLPSEFRDGLPAPTTRSKYEYEVTIWYRRNGIDSVLIRTGGTIGSPFGCHEVLGSAAS